MSQPARRTAVRALLGTFASLMLCGSFATVGGVPFRPDVLQQLKSGGSLPAIVAADQAAIQRGLDHPPATAAGWLRQDDRGRELPARNAIVILVDFSDKRADQITYPPPQYSEMLFSVGTYPTGSMRDWYLENSYGAFTVTGQVTPWLRMPQPYSYYVNGQAGFGAYPRNAQKLAEDAAITANRIVDFSQYDNDGPDGIPNSGDDDGYVDALFVVHAGRGREETGNNNDIHSHAWAMYMPVHADGVIAYSYSMEPENGKRGVFGHEFGHVLGLPDLYDTDYSSSGVGDWCMMSFGSWGNGGLTPVHFLSWCKERLGFLDPTAPLYNVDVASLPQVETSPTAFNLWTGGYPERQYFVIENRQRILSDAYLPGDGLVICHIDETVSGNTDENHPLVAIEQADGLNELAHGGGSDSGDPWPGSTLNRNLTGESNPNTGDYDGNPTQVAARDISDSGPAMTADLEVENAPILVFQRFGIQEVSGNGDGDIDPGEQWDMPVSLQNRGAAANSITATLSSGDPYVTVQIGDSDFGAMGAESEATGSPAYRLTLDPGATGDALSFQLAVQDQLRSVTNLQFIVGVNDLLDFFGWTHDNVTEGYGDQWHISTQRNHTPGGSHSWKCGAEGEDVYAESMPFLVEIRRLPSGFTPPWLVQTFRGPGGACTNACIRRPS